MILFFLLAFVAVAGALAVVVAPNPIHSAVALVFTLIATAGIFLSLGAQFLAVVQVIVYAGAIMVLFIFVIMLLNVKTGESGDHNLGSLGFKQAIGIAAATLLLLQLAVLAMSARGPGIQPAVSADELTAQAGGHSQAIGLLLYGRYLLPFEVASLLLLVAIVGAVAMSRRHLVMGQDRDESTGEVS